MRTLRGVVIVIFAMAALAGTGEAQRPVSEGHRASFDGTVKVVVPHGAVRIVGWAHDSVSIEGLADADAGELLVQRDGRATRVRLDEDAPLGSTSETAIVIYVPARSFAAVRTVTATIEIRDVSGGVDLYSETGAVTVLGEGTRSVYAESAGGDVVIDAQTKIARAKSMDGSVRVSRAHGFVEISTVGGDIVLHGGELTQGEVTSVSGSIEFVGDFERGAFGFVFETHSGRIDLKLPRYVSADFEISNIHGEIESEFGRPENGSLATGGGGPRVKISSFKGRIRILRQ